MESGRVETIPTNISGFICLFLQLSLWDPGTVELIWVYLPRLFPVTALLYLFIPLGSAFSAIFFSSLLNERLALPSCPTTLKQKRAYKGPAQSLVSYTLKPASKMTNGLVYELVSC